MKKLSLFSWLIAGVTMVTCPTVKWDISYPENLRAPKIAMGFAEALADTTSSTQTDTCASAFKAVVAAMPSKGTYAEPVLDNLHMQLYQFNTIETADVEMIFCRIVNVMGINPDLSSLPQTVSKTDPLGGTVSVTVSAPTETFAATNGYTFKAVLTYTSASASTGSIFMTLWWVGSGSSSKGYLIQSANPMEKDGMNRLRYIQWDLTSTTQIVKVLSTQFASSFLNSVTGASSSTTGGDSAHYGRMSYNTATKAITAQAIEIRTTPATPTAFACVRTTFSGTLGGTVTAFRPAKGTPEATTDTYTDGTDLDGVAGVTDSTATVPTQSQQADSSSLTTVFDYSCNDIDGANATGKPFASNTVSYSIAPSSIFPK